MVATLINSAAWAQRADVDGEFLMAARGWTGGLRVEVDDAVTGFTIDDGRPTPGVPEDNKGSAVDGTVVVTMSTEAWRGLTAATPPPGLTDVHAATHSGLRSDFADMTWWQYAPAIQRAIELIRPERPAPNGRRRELPAGVLSAPVGRYANVNLGGVTHRIYFEEAGSGIPMLLQHTAGSHGTQWRHLFEMPEITDNFRLIAYDLPYHGKSIPPVGPAWWKTPYVLKGEFLRSVPIELARLLQLETPVFMGCSVGGLLALDLAHKAADFFRAVIAVEGALNIPGNLDRLVGFHHPQVSNDMKARMMEGLTAPMSPIEYVKETTQTYAAGWPPAFIGDLHYYIDEFDLSDGASEIDTAQVGVHILVGEYDHSATPAMSRAAHEAIAGSTFSVMENLGHFPMSENPDRFLDHLLPVLDAIRRA